MRDKHSHRVLDYITFLFKLNVGSVLYYLETHLYWWL